MVRLLIALSLTMGWLHTQAQSLVQRNPLFANASDKLQGFVGLSFEFVPITLQGQQVFSSPPSFYGLVVGGNYTLLEHADVVSLSAMGSLTGAFSYNSLAGTTLFFQAPLIAMGRVGANATKFNDQAVGLGLGLGASYSYLNLPFLDNLNNVRRITDGFVSPVAVVELFIHPHSWATSFALRGHASLTATKSGTRQPALQGTNASLSGADYKPSYSTFAVGLVYYF